MKSICVSLLSAAALMISACATVVNGTTERVEIASDPPGAAAKVDGIPIGTTPTSIDLKRGNPHTVMIEKDGYVTAEETLAQETSWWVAGNVVVGSLAGFWVDYSDGAMYNLTPKAVSPVLVASPMQPASRSVSADVPQASNPPIPDNSKGAPNAAPRATSM